MADEVQNASAGDESKKRNYEGSKTPATRRTKGNSMSGSKLPPRLKETEWGKQKAQGIAGRLVNSADPLKTARVDDGGVGSGGFDASAAGMAQRPQGLGLNGPHRGVSNGYPIPSKKIEIPVNRVGLIIGKGGAFVKHLQLLCGAEIWVTRDRDADPNSTSRAVELLGTPDQIAKAEQLISNVINTTEAGAFGIVHQESTLLSAGAEQFLMKIPNHMVGVIIGKRGETIRHLRVRTGAYIQIVPQHLPPGDLSEERTVKIDGTSEQIEFAKLLINEIIGENPMRNPLQSGGYSQLGYQARPPTNWAQSGAPMRQPDYGYVQPGAYPRPSLQFSQSPYSGYPPQRTSGWYATNWDQAAAARGYYYYNQQRPPQQQQAHGSPSGPADRHAYGYGLPRVYIQGQSYGQDSHAGYDTGPAQFGYDQQQQGYNSSYGSVFKPTPYGQTPSHGMHSETNQAPPAPGQFYNAGVQPSPKPNYHPQTSTRLSQGICGTQASAVYGSPQAQKTLDSGPAYASAQGGAGAQSGSWGPALCNTTRDST